MSRLPPLALVLAAAPPALLEPVAMLLVAAALLASSRSERQAIDRRLVPAALFVLLAALRCASSAPALWWPAMLGWLVLVASAAAGAAAPLALQARPLAWRRACPPLALAAALLALAGALPASLPAAALAAVGWVERHRLSSRDAALAALAWAAVALLHLSRPDGSGPAVALVCGLLLCSGGSPLRARLPWNARELGVGLPMLVAGLAALVTAFAPQGGHGGAAMPRDLELALLGADGWWRAQAGGLELLRLHPLLGVGPGHLVPGSALSVLPGSLPADEPVASGFVALLVTHGWLGYALLAASAHGLLRGRVRAEEWAVAAALALAPASADGTALRLAPLAGLLIAERLAPSAAPGRELSLAALSRSALPVRAAGLAAGLVLVLGGAASAGAGLLQAAGDASARRLHWPQAERLYVWAARVGPQPAHALHRLSDLRLRRARYQGNAGLGQAAGPLHDVLALGLDDAWTFYRLGEIELLSRPGGGRSTALYREAAARAPRSAAIRVALGHRYLHLGRIEEAIEELGRAVQLRPELLPRLFRDLRRITTNGALLRRLLPPGDLRSHVRLARLFEETGLVPAAIREHEILAAHGTLPAWVVREYADLLARSGRVELARARLNELTRWPELGPAEQLEVLLRLVRLETSPARRSSHLAAVVDLLPPARLTRAQLEPLVLELAPAEAAAAVERALSRLERLRSLRPSLDPLAAEGLRGLLAELQGR
jgi:tetratricopeptide (TPR) repeat protein